MISANELRIGNYVASDHFKDRDVIVKVRLIGQDQAIVEHPNGLSEPMLYKGEMRGIVLTEELLLKCGFRLDKSTSDIKLFLPVPKLSVEIHATFYHGQFVIELVNHLVPIVTEATYLHQLQNLHYALCGKELEVKL
ncbi:hypothetical protein [Sphingobacterium sp.]|uniref:hypothetical protein n=1 Tax=Sphingobacterium sp. TaxID=341027 RepID=UPI002FDEC730